MRPWCPGPTPRKSGFRHWVVLLAVLRLTTRPSVFARPLRTAEAFDIIDEWLAQPCALVLHPTIRHPAPACAAS